MAKKYEFANEREEPLVTFRRFGGPIHLSAITEITPAGQLLPELSWLVALGWYLVVKMHDDAGTAAAAAG